MDFRAPLLQPPRNFALFALCCVVFSLPARAGPSRETRAGLSDKRPIEPPAVETAGNDLAPAAGPGWELLVGGDGGLFSLDWPGAAKPLWTGGSVRKIVSAKDADNNAVWMILGSEGIAVSRDLQNWESRSQGLPVKTIKNFQSGKKTFLSMTQEIKDLEVNPADSDIMVCATKDRVYLSRNQGRSWSSLGAPPYRTNGIKAVAAAYMPTSPGGGGGSGVLTVFLSHSTYGLFYIQPDRAGAQWTEINDGLEKLETTDNADEVSDIAVVPGAAAEIYVSQTFRRRIYRMNWHQKKFSLVWSDDTARFGTVDSLDAGRTSLRFVQEGMIAEIGYAAGGGAAARTRPELPDLIRRAAKDLDPNCVVIREKNTGAEPVVLSELWLLDAADPSGPAKPAAGNAQSGNRAAAADREGLYLPVNHAMDSGSLKPYLDVIAERGLNMIVIDMKDDYGRLRFTPRDQAISEKGRVFRPLDIDSLLLNLKKRGIYAVARVVVFKDPVLAAKAGGKYAVWDGRNNRPWAGYYDTRQKQGTGIPEKSNYESEILPADEPGYEVLRTFYDERWVDPYSEEVWEYTAAVAQELYGRGFDEIQFDYIRFPTDGANLGDARYRWQENGMDMESAMLSFLRHIRSRVKAPISIDIYGANGWYRTGARTGQEVELLAPWVDVICPMYYPSHFEQDFLAQNPPDLRPWRIYFQGTLRTARIGRGKIIVRPYVQAFYLNVSYDRKYYNSDYVRREVEGVRDAGRGGLTYWNNSGRYEDIPIPVKR
jgi:hypothetical protein